MISRSLTFWTLVAGLITYAASWYFPSFPFDNETVLSALLFVLGLIGIVPQLQLYGFRGAIQTGIIYSLAFWQLVAGLVSFILHFWAPNFPFDQVTILAFIIFVLGFFGVTPELRARGLLPPA